MDQKAAYEKTITEKLELLSVPDMVDAIWARIETQLDIDMPPDEGPVNPPATPPGRSGPWNGIVITFFIAALVATIYFTNRNPIRNNNNEAISPANTTIITSPENINDKPPPSRTIILSSPPTPPAKNAPLPLLPDKDSLSSVDDGAGASIPDSVINNAVVTPVPVFPPADSSKKNGRGVRGIKDADYRITPVKKDSVN
jgi:hypothetical protein